MPALTGPFAVALLLLILAGGFKILDPSPTDTALRQSGLPSGRGSTRALGVAESALALAALLVGGRFVILGVAGVYLGFAWFVWRALRLGLPIQSCGCFGRVDTPPSYAHIVVNAAAAGVAATMAFTHPEPLISLFTGTDAVPVLLGTAVATYLLYVMLAVMPAALHRTTP